MPRIRATLLLVGFVLVPVTPADDRAPPTQPKVLPVAPFPHQPGESHGLELPDLDLGIELLLPPAEQDTDLPVPAPLPPLPPAERAIDDLSIPAPFAADLPNFSPAGLSGPGSLAPNIPAGPASVLDESRFRSRVGSARAKLLKEYGGNEASERAVALGLAWLARQQQPDGGWIYEGSDKTDRIAATGMALLPFLAAGETHQSGKKYQKVVASGLQFLQRNCPPSGPNAGKFTGAENMYSQAIGTLALCEAYGMTRDKELLEYAQAAINYIVKGQGSNGSWGYSAGSAGDTSIVGWQIQALHAARLSKDMIVPAGTIRGAINFLDLAGGGSRKASYGYNDNAGAAPGTALTAVGLLCRHDIDGWGPDNPGMAEGVLGLMKRAPGGGPRRPALDTYFYYYATQVVRAFEGEEWKTWNEGPKDAKGNRTGGMRDWLIELQNKKEGVLQGSWEADGGWIGRSCGRLGTTALCVLTLEVYYRYPPLYQRGNNGAAIKVINPGW